MYIYVYSTLAIVRGEGLWWVGGDVIVLGYFFPLPDVIIALLISVFLYFGLRFGERSLERYFPRSICASFCFCFFFFFFFFFAIIIVVSSVAAFERISYFCTIRDTWLMGSDRWSRQQGIGWGGVGSDVCLNIAYSLLPIARGGSGSH